MRNDELLMRDDSVIEIPLYPHNEFLIIEGFQIKTKNHS